MRSSGILMPITSLPSNYGIGVFSKEAYNFIDFLKKAGQSYWQILPLGPTGYGDSPYQSFSTFAGNPYFIDLEALIEEGLLKKEECEKIDLGEDDQSIDYGKLYKGRFTILNKAYERSNCREDRKFLDFRKDNMDWLEDYSLFMAIKDKYKGVSWSEWDDTIRLRDTKALKQMKEELKEEIEFYQYLQFLFINQWKKLKIYANANGIEIIGDLPIYVSSDSADSWANPELFQFDEDRIPSAVAGCPPDAFSATGQLWGNPLYNWDYHKSTNYEWWLKRIAYCFNLYDMVRIDHFRGFDEYYAIPYGNKTAEFGEWRQGPGYDIFDIIHKKLGDLNIIAEDLGFLTKSVLDLVKKSGFPGMKVLEFAFDSREESDYLPHNYEKNCIVYTGTHDNQTLVGWYQELDPLDKQFSIEYLANYHSKEDEIHWDFIRLALASVANLAIIPIQDYLGLGVTSRINTPSTLGNNWKWRLKKGDLTEELTEKIARMVKIYARGK